MPGIGVLGLTRVAAVAVAESRVSRSAGKTITPNLATLIDMNTVAVDDLDAWNAALNTRLTAPAAGRYLLHCSGRWSGRVYFYSIMALLVNGATVAEEKRSGDNGTDQIKQALNHVMKLAAGDRIEMSCYQTDTGFNKTMTGATLALVRV